MSPIAPPNVAMRYKECIYSTLVSESISDPISSPVDASGRYVEKLVPMSLATLTAIDRNDCDGYKVTL
ncbi:hypothetical protein [Nitrosomonas communis]|uniref:hypothetical protein n=1 Tax=Nitrosomonas communis TaxID=44574 RepID=UPI003D274E58